MIWPLILLLLVSSGTRAKEWFWSRSKEQDSALELSYKPGSEIAWVGTLSGELHALNTKTGTVLWSADIGGSTLRSFQALDSSDVGVVVPGVDGSVFVHTQGELKRFPLTVPDFVEKSPMFQVLPNGRKLTIVGSKIDRVFQLDADTGRIVRSFSSEPGDDLNVENEDEFKSETAGAGINLLLVNRQDYRVRAFDEESGKEVWNFTYGVIDPISARPDAEPSSLLMDAHAKLLLDRVQTLWKHPSPIASAAVTLENDALVIAKRSMLQNAMTEAPSNPSAIVKRMVLQDGAIQLYVSPSEPAMERKSVSKRDVESKAVAIVSDDSTLIPADVDDGTCAIALGSHKVVPFIPEALGSYPNVSRPSNSNNLNAPNQSFSPEALMLTWFAFASLILFAFIVRFWRRSTSSSQDEKKANNNNMESIVVSKESDESIAVSSHEDSSVQSVTTRSVIMEQDANGDVSHRVGKLNIYMSKIKGYGGNGTIVVEGRFEERPVAIKRMQSALYDRASKEIDFLIQSEGHSNVVRYLAKEETPDFVYLALELCEMTLDQAIEQRLNELGQGTSPSSWISDENRLFLHELASATNHLHVNGIVHCDIKPQNVLVVPRPNRANGSANSLDIGSKWMPKLSDMGLSRNVDVDQSSFRLKSHTSTHDTKGHMIGGGTVGWRAPELLVRSKDKKSRLSRKVDVFSLGCVFFYILRDGGHPFGEWLQRESQIVKGNAVGMERLPASFAEAKHLIAEMIALEPTKRPSMAACLSHPLLWNSKVRLDFLCDVSNRLEKVDPSSGTLKDLEARSKKLFSPISGWAVRLDTTLERDVNASKHRKYDVGSFRDLLRYIRNKRHHFDEDPELSRVLSWEPELFLEVFCKSYPDLVTQTFEWALLHCGNEPKFVDLFGGSEVITERCERMPRLVQDEPVLSASCKRQAGPTSREWYVDNWVDDFPDHPPIPMPPSFNHKSNLCAHWERSGGQFCVMGSKCGFAHGVIELRVLPETVTRPPPPTVSSVAQGRQSDKKPPRVMMNKTPIRKPTIPGFDAFG